MKVIKHKMFLMGISLFLLSITACTKFDQIEPIYLDYGRAYVSEVIDSDDEVLVVLDNQKVIKFDEESAKRSDVTDGQRVLVNYEHVEQGSILEDGYNFIVKVFTTIEVLEKDLLIFPEGEEDTLKTEYVSVRDISIKDEFLDLRATYKKAYESHSVELIYDVALQSEAPNARPKLHLVNSVAGDPIEEGNTAIEQSYLSFNIKQLSLEVEANNEGYIFFDLVCNEGEASQEYYQNIPYKVY